MPIPIQRPKRAADAAIAAALVVASLLVRWSIDGAAGDYYPYFPLFLAAAAVAWWRGAFPGLLVLLGGAPIALLLFVPPRGSLIPIRAIDWIGLAMYLATGLPLIVLAEARLRAVRRAQAAAAELGEKAAALADANERLAHANGELARFADIVAHDLKAPLRGASHHLACIAEDCGPHPDPRAAARLTSTRALIDHTRELLGALYEYASLGRTELRRKTVSLRDVAALVADSLEPRGYADTVNIGPLPVAEVDPVLARQALANLVSNGLRYNNSPGKHVEVGFADGAIFVRDNGIGIDLAHQAEVFQMFRRLPDAQKFGAGLGAGLAVVKRIAERHGGRIWLESTAGCGSTFYLTLWPPETTPAPPVESAVIPAEPARR